LLVFILSLAIDEHSATTLYRNYEGC